MRHGEKTFVDSGAWIALALTRDPLHDRALEDWEILTDARARLQTSIPVVIETFTLLQRNVGRDIALNSLYTPEPPTSCLVSSAISITAGKFSAGRSFTSFRLSTRRALPS